MAWRAVGEHCDFAGVSTICIGRSVMESARKRRKWDVAAPGGMPLAGNRAGIGAGGTSQSGLNGFITAQGHQIASIPSPVTAVSNPYPAPSVTTQPATDQKPNQAIDQATIARAQQGAQAIVERINAVCSVSFVCILSTGSR